MELNIYFFIDGCMRYVRVSILKMRSNKRLMRALPVQLVLHMFPDPLVSPGFVEGFINNIHLSPFLLLTDLLSYVFLVESPMMSAFKIKEPGMSYWLDVHFLLGLSW